MSTRLVQDLFVDTLQGASCPSRRFSNFSMTGKLCGNIDSLCEYISRPCRGRPQPKLAEQAYYHHRHHHHLVRIITGALQGVNPTGQGVNPTGQGMNSTCVAVVLARQDHHRRPAQCEFTGSGCESNWSRYEFNVHSGRSRPPEGELHVALD